MPGIWNDYEASQREQRSGFYLNFVGDKGAGVASGDLGVVALAAFLNWGPTNTVVDIDTQDTFNAVYGEKFESTVPGHFLAKGAFKASPQLVKVYRMDNGGVAASVNLLQGATNLVTIPAKYAGTRGNDFNATIATNALDGTKKDLTLYDGSKALGTVTYDGTATNLVALLNDTNSPLAKYTGTAVKVADGTTDNVVNKALTGGTNGSALTATQYAAAMTSFETTGGWNVAVFNNTTDNTIHATIKSWVNRLRAEGKYVVVVLGAATPAAGSEASGFDAACTAASSMDSEGIIYHHIYGKEKGDTTVYSPAEWCGRIAGLVAAYGPFRSLTHARLDDIELSYPLTNTQIRKANKNGLMVAFNGGNTVLIEKGINTKVTYDTTKKQHEGWSKIKVVAVMDATGSALSASGNTSWAGQVPNDEDGADFVIGAVKAYLRSLEQGISRLYKAGTTDAWVDTARPQTGDQFFFVWKGTPVDSMDEIYGTGVIGR